MITGLDIASLASIQAIFNTWGWFGVSALMAFETATSITPGDVVLGLAGWLLIQAQQLSPSMIFLGGFYTALGSTIGASITYWMARMGGRPLIDGLFRRFRMNPSPIDRAEALFQRWGASLALFGRFIPGLRVWISIPAGLSRMSFVTFFAATFIGSYIYCTSLIAAGYLVGQEWQLVVVYLKKYLPHLLVLGVAGAIIYIVIAYRTSLLKFISLRSTTK